jgi:hypothetical protein
MINPPNKCAYRTEKSDCPEDCLGLLDEQMVRQFGDVLIRVCPNPNLAGQPNHVQHDRFNRIIIVTSFADVIPTHDEYIKIGESLA